MSNPQKRNQPITSCVFLFIACLLLCAPASAAPTIALSQKSGPPTSKILVSGRGFEPNVGVDIFWDTKDKTLVVTNRQGEFHDATIHAPRSARPGRHWVTALERNNDRGAQIPFLVRTNWSQFQFAPSQDGVNPFENVLDPDTVGALNLRWSYATLVGSSAAVVDGTVYVGGYSDGNVYALDALTGSLQWTYATLGYVSSSPAVDHGLVYVGSGDSNIYALDARTGSLAWYYRTGNQIGFSPTVLDGVVYIGSADFNLYALNARNGALLWSHRIGSGTAPAVANGVVYIGSSDGNLYALNAHNGAKLWSYATGVYSSAAVADGVVYVGGGYNNRAYALNASTGAELWAFTTPANSYAYPPAVANGVVYVCSQNTYALDANTGIELWEFPNSGPSWPTVADEVVYIGGPGYVYALDARDGALLWSYATGSGGYGNGNSSPTVANGVVYVGSLDGNFYAFGSSSGASKMQRAPRYADLRALRSDARFKRPAAGATQEKRQGR